MGKNETYMDADEVAEYLGCKKYYAYRMIKTINERMRAEFPNAFITKGRVNRKYFIRCVDPLSATETDDEEKI